MLPLPFLVGPAFAFLLGRGQALRDYIPGYAVIAKLIHARVTNLTGHLGEIGEGSVFLGHLGHLLTNHKR